MLPNIFTNFQDKNAKYNAFEKDIAVAIFYFGEATALGELAPKLQFYTPYPEYKRSVRMTFLDLIAGFGGLFGLFLGFSLVSFLELLYWATVRLVRNSAG